MTPITKALKVLLALFTVFNISLTHAQPCNIDARVTHIPPLFYQDESEKWVGLTIDLTKALLKEAQCDVHFENINWARSLELMKTGKVDMMMNMSITDERSKYIHFIGPHNDETIQILMKKTINTEIKSLDDIKNLPGKIGIQHGAFFGKAFNNKLKTDPVFADKFDKTYSQENNVKKLKLGRIIGILRQNYSGVSAEIELMKTGNYKINPFIINKNEVYFGFSKKSVSKKMLKRFVRYDSTIIIHHVCLPCLPVQC